MNCEKRAHLLVHLSLRTMDLAFDHDEDFIFVDEGWSIYLPNEDTTTVAICFSEETDPGYAAYTAIRFSNFLILSGMTVVVLPCFTENDSTGIIEVQ